jgi:hypothetical protein
MSKVEDLLEKCDEKIHKELRTFYWTFVLDFKPVYHLIMNDFDAQKLTKDELEQFIRICNNRLALFKEFLKDLSIVLSVDFIGLSIIATLIAGNGSNLVNILFFDVGDILISIFVWILIVTFIVLFYSMAICRRLTYLWTIFKEIAILKQIPSTSS